MTHHYPRDLLQPFFQQDAVTVVKEDQVYQLQPGGLKSVRIIVCRTTDNPLLGLFSDDYQKFKESYARLEQESNLLDEVSGYLHRIKQYFGEVM